MDASVYQLLLPYLRWLIPQALVRAGCEAPQCEEFELAGAVQVEASPVLTAHARPLETLGLP